MAATVLRLGNTASQFRLNAINALLVPLINWRGKTFEKNVGRAKSLQVRTCWSYLSNNMQAYPRRSDRGCAAFFSQNRHKIREIMPGRSSSVYHSFMDKFEAADIAADRILNEEEHALC